MTLQTIDIWLDDWNILTLNKKAAPSDQIPISKDIRTKTRESVMEVYRVEREMIQMDARWLDVVSWRPPQLLPSWASSGSGSSEALRGLFSRFTGGLSSNSNATGSSSRDLSAAAAHFSSGDLSASHTASIFLNVTTAEIRTSVSSSFAQELERATKKPPPQRTTVAVLTPLHDHLSPTSDSHTLDVFSTVLPTKSGKIFIGFPTAQTTGLLAHISAPSVIPTVERESIDLNARYVRTWNIEILRAAGIVCRIAWTCEMNTIKEKLSRSGTNAEILLPEAVTISNQFTYQESTPSSQVGQLLEEAFWTSGKTASIELFSSQGVLPSHQVRLATEDLSGFVHSLPIVPKRLVDDAQTFIRRLKEYGFLTEVSVSDVKDELEKKTLDEKQLHEFLGWIARKMVQGTIPADAARSLMNVAVASLAERLVLLADLKYFVSPSRIPVDLPLPPSVAPFSCTRDLSRTELEALGWEELQIVPWLRFLVDDLGGGASNSAEKNITLSAPFSARILPVISKSWDSLSQSSKDTVSGLLADRTVMPTKMGMRKPSDAYFPNVKIFQDLPVVSGLSGVKDKFLLALGVRKTIELSVIFDRLMSTSQPAGDEDSTGKWSHVDLVRYLASVRDDIPLDDIKRLKATPLCPAEADQDPSKPGKKRFRIGELYEPKDALRGLELPLLQWPGVYRTGSPEGRFLAFLGLRAGPVAPDLISILANSAADKNAALYNRAISYYVLNYNMNDYGKFTEISNVTRAFLPLEGGGFDSFAAPSACFTQERSTIFGFRLLRKDLHTHASKFGVRADPPISECIRRLLKEPPQTKREASAKFSYLYYRLGEISQENLRTLGNALIIPVFPETRFGHAQDSKHGQTPRLVPPSLCFIGSSSTYGDIFDFVDFGPDANTFLRATGSKDTPSNKEVAELIAREPTRVLGTLQSPEKYLSLLRNLAANFATLKQDKSLLKQLQRAPCLLAYREVSPDSAMNGARETHSVNGDSREIDAEYTAIKEWTLASAAKIVVNNDIISFSLFKHQLLTAPDEEGLELFYQSLGSPSISQLVEETPRIGAKVQDQTQATKLRKLVCERARLFLDEYPPQDIRHNGTWLENNLVVEAVRSISLRRNLRGQTLISHTEDRTAAIKYDPQKRWVLSITAEGYDLFDVSQALVNLMLHRPKPNSAITVEMLLRTELLKLRSRGYNVERILRARAAEARIAEEQRLKQVEEERKRIHEQEKSWNESHRAKTPERPPLTQGSIPGSFSESPEHVSSDDSSSRTKKPRGLLSSITKRLGLDEGSRPGRQSQNLLTQTSSATGAETDAPPPPYSPEPPQQQQAQGPDRVTAPHQLQTNLLKAVNAARAHDSSSLYNRPEGTIVKESDTYCDERPGHDMSFAAESPPGIKIFLANSLANKSAFLAAHTLALNLFAGILVDCAQVFALPRASLHIFYDERGNSIAFNRQGSLFCNFRFFEQLHLNGLLQQQQSGRLAQSKADALIYWFVVLSHELAHNLVGDHSAEHSYWTWVAFLPLLSSSAI